MRKPIIVRASISDTVEILGHKVTGYKAIIDAIEVSSTPALFDIRSNGKKVVWSKPYTSEQTPRRPIPGLHVLEIYERYPCFDSSDYAYENRYFRNFFFSEKPFTPEDIRTITELDRRGNLEFFSDKMPEITIPSAYYVGEGNTIICAF